MASLTGNTIQSTYDALLKVTDNGSITGSLKRITDGLGNNTPLYLSNSAAEFTSALNVTGAITGSNLSGTNTGDETNASIKSKLGAATGSNDGYLTSADWTTFMAKIAGSGTLNKLAKFSSSSSIADSTITDTGSAVTIGVATSVTGSLTASSIIKSGGTSSQFLKADGSIDSNSYALASSLSSYVPTSRTLTINGTSYDLTANRSWSVGTVTSVGLELGTTGTDLGVVNSPITSSGNITLNVPNASATNRGVLTSTDWSTFNAKQNALTLTTTGNSGSATLVGSTLNIPTYTLSGLGGQPLLTNPVTGTGTSSYLPKFTGASTIGNSIVYDATIGVGIGTTSVTNYSGFTNLSVGGSSRGLIAVKNNANNDIGFLYNSGSNLFTIESVLDNLQLTSASGKDLVLATNGSSERMRITSGGNVGIGTTSPSTLLHVAGTATVQVLNISTSAGLVGNVNSSNANGGYLTWQTSGTTIADIGTLQQIFGAGGSTNFGINARGARDLGFGTNNTERMRITSGGNVGIGTSSPSYTLDVNGTGRFGGNISSSPLEIANTLLSNYIFANSGSGYEAMTRYYNPTAGNWYTGIRVSAGLGSTSSYHIYSSTYGGDVLALNTNGTAAFAGNVGIGTTSPQAPLQVVGTGIGGYGLISARGENAHLGFRTAADAFKGWVGYFNSVTHGSDVDLNIKTGYNGASNIRFSINGDSGEAMRITSAGNVGIGTTSPSSSVKLHVYDGSANGDIALFESAITKADIWLKDTNTSTGAVRLRSESNSMAMIAGGSERMRINSSGNLLIGTTSDIFNNAKLQVNGGMTYQNLFNRRTASYTLSISDQNYIVEMNVGSANNLTVPPNSSVAFPVGTEIAVLQYGAGQTTIVAGSGVTLKSKSNALKISGQYAGCTLVKIGTDEWYVIGDLVI